MALADGDLIDADHLGACLDFCVLRHSMSTERDMYATQDDEESDSPIIGAAA
jgi:hypothetical protein